MKEWCMKHPWMTFFLIDWIACDIANAIAGRKSKNSIDRFESAADTVNETFQEVKRKIKKVEEKEDRTIGFKVS